MGFRSALDSFLTYFFRSCGANIDWSIFFWESVVLIEEVFANLFTCMFIDGVHSQGTIVYSHFQNNIFNKLTVFLMFTSLQEQDLCVLCQQVLSHDPTSTTTITYPSVLSPAKDKSDRAQHRADVGLASAGKLVERRIWRS